MKIVAKATQMMKSLYTPFGSLIAVIVFLLVVIAVLRMTGVTIGLGANAHVGRLHGSFAVEGFEEHATWFGGKKKGKHTPDIEVTAAKYTKDANTYLDRIKDAYVAYYKSGATDSDKRKAQASYNENLSKLKALGIKATDLKSKAAQNVTAANTDQLSANAVDTLLNDTTLSSNYPTATTGYIKRATTAASASPARTTADLGYLISAS